MDPYEEYMKAYCEADQAGLDNRSFRLAADKFWKAIRLAPAGVWTKYRLYCLQSYVFYLGKDLIVPTKKDYDKLEKRMLNNEDEPNIFRANAAFCLGFMYYNDKKNYEEAAECFRRCLDLCESASPEEKDRIDISMLMVADDPPLPRQLSLVFDRLKAKALKGLQMMEGCELLEDSVCVQDPVRCPWHVYPRLALVPVFGDIGASIGLWGSSVRLLWSRP